MRRGLERFFRQPSIQRRTAWLFLLLGCRGSPGTLGLGTRASVALSASTATPLDRAIGAGLPPVRAVMDDPRLAEAHAFELALDYAAAARALERARASPDRSELTLAEECAWNYTLGRFYDAAGDAANAAVAYDRVGHRASGSSAEASCLLGPYANLRASAAYLKTGDATTAALRARSVPDDIAEANDAHLVLANALAEGGNAAQAVPLWRALVASDPNRWVDVACPLSLALLDGADGPSDLHAAEALDLVTRVLTDAPKIEVSSGALALRARALALVRAKDSTVKPELSPEQRARRAKTWLDAGEAKRALAETESLLASLGKNASRSVPAALLCNASLTRAQAAARAKLANTQEAWSTAIERCAHEDALVTALYQGAKSSLAKEPQVAMDRFAQVEKLFPTHRLADDARFQAALAALGQRDEARFSAMMLSLPDDYPEGDMRGEALFRVALLRMTKGDWVGAAPLLDRIMSLTPGDRHWATSGRAAYFRARVAQSSGQHDEALDRYARIVEEQPLTFYMTLAYARIADEDPARARRTLDLAMANEDSGPLLTHEHPEFSRLDLQRGLRLLEVGDVEGAKREIGASGAAGESSDPETLWAIALLYDLAGAPEIGHAFARSRLTDYLAHYPAGRWKTMWEIAYPRAYASLVEPESRAHGLPVALTWAIMREESDFYADAKSASNAYGLMQLIASTARGVAAGTPYGWDEAQLKRPDASIALGTKLLAGLRAQFAYNPALAIAAYNAGGGAVGRWIAARGDQDFDLWVEQIPWDETRGYIKRVLASEAAYGLLYDRAAFDDVLSLARRASGARLVDAGRD
jgi:soluble lytic murein transglycosylase